MDRDRERPVESVHNFPKLAVLLFLAWRYVKVEVEEIWKLHWFGTAMYLSECVRVVYVCMSECALELAHTFVCLSVCLPVRLAGCPKDCVASSATSSTPLSFSRPLALAHSLANRYKAS